MKIITIASKLGISVLITLSLCSCPSSIQKLEDAAGSGNERSQYSLYEAYLNGDDKLKVKRDTAAAHRWLEKSAQSYNRARLELIDNYLRGHNGYPENRSRAISLAKQYGGSYNYPLIQINDSTFAQMERFTIECNAKLDGWESRIQRENTMGNLQQKVARYDGYIAELDRYNKGLSGCLKVANKTLEEINFVNSLNKLGLEGVSYPMPSTDKITAFQKTRNNFERVTRNMTSKRWEWVRVRQQAQSSLNIANSLEQAKNNGSGYGSTPAQPYRQPRSGFIVPGAQ